MHLLRDDYLKTTRKRPRLLFSSLLCPIVLSYSNMSYSFFIGGVSALLAVVCFLLIPLHAYFRDAKGLRKYPAINPLAGITNAGFMWEAYRGFRSKKLYDVHQEHPVIRIGPNSLSYGSLAAIKDIYGHSTKCIKDEFYIALAGSHFHLADVVDKHEHARKRKVLSNAYALKNLEGWEHKVADKARRFVKACDRHCTTPLKTGTRPDAEDLTFDYRAYSNFFTLDAIADIGLSEQLGFLDAGNDSVIGEKMGGEVYTVPSYRAGLHATAKAQSVLVWATTAYSFNSKYLCRLLPSFRKLWQLNEGWNDLVYRRAAVRMRRYEAGEKLDDFFQALMEDKNGNPHNLDWGEIIAEVSIMLNAGSDTTALAMNNVMFHLLNNPACLTRLREEIDSVMNAGEDVAAYDTVRHLPYLRACLDESLRLTPPTTFGLPRRTPPEGFQILDEWIPGDTTVSISAYVAHRDPIVFPDPECYLSLIHI